MPKIVGAGLSRHRVDCARHLLGAATSLIALSLALPAHAQDAVPSTSQAQDEEIIVTGIRGSLQRNLDAKRNASGVIEQISSEDIGKFPDSNVAASLQRLRASRSSATGRAASRTASRFAALAATSTKPWSMGGGSRPPRADVRSTSRRSVRISSAG